MFESSGRIESPNRTVRKRPPKKTSRLRGATVTEGVCPPCAPSVVGNSSTPKAGSSSTSKATPQSDQRRNTLSKGVKRLPTLGEPAPRHASALPRARTRTSGKSKHWIGRSTGSRMCKAARDADFTVRNEAGRLLNSVRSYRHAWRGDHRQQRKTTSSRTLFGGGLGVVSG